jgi:hypothetical protein
MKNLLSILLVAGIVTFVSCGPSAEEQKKLQDKIQHKQDSLDNVKRISDSIDAVLSARYAKRRDSIKNIEDKAFRLTPAGRIWQQHPQWSKEDCENLSNGKIWIGMSIDMVKYRRGLPDHVNTSNYGNGNEYQWCWDDFNPSCFYGGADGIVTSYN